MDKRRLALAIGCSVATVMMLAQQKTNSSVSVPPVPPPPSWVVAQSRPTAVHLDTLDAGTAPPRVAVPERAQEREGEREGPPALSPWLSPRLAKLQVKSSWHASAIGIEDQLLLKDLQQSLSQLWINHIAPTNDAIFFGVSNQGDLARMGSLKNGLKASGVLWVFYRKSMSVNESKLMASARAAELLQTKAIRFSTTYNAVAFTP